MACGPVGEPSLKTNEENSSFLEEEASLAKEAEDDVALDLKVAKF